MASENVMRLWNDCMDGGNVRPKFPVTAKTTHYTVTSNDFGSILTTRGNEGSLIFTLPAASSKNAGEWVLFINIANQIMLINGADEGLVTIDDLTADSIAFATENELIGGMFLAISDGTSWLVVPIATETQTITVLSG